MKFLKDSSNVNRLLRNRAQRGAKLLDEKMPGWATKIDLLILKCRNYYNCPLGQISGNLGYHSLANQLLGIKRGVSDYGTQKEAVYGFDISASTKGIGYSDLPPYWETLQTRWVEQIKQRLALTHSGKKFTLGDLVAIVSYKKDGKVRAGKLHNFSKKNETLTLEFNDGSFKAYKLNKVEKLMLVKSI